MATKDERPGLLSKVAMFVRNPTKDWSELDQPEQSAEAGYDKQALKAMIERKRQNDFVRRREFDQLRKLRNRDPGAVANAARPSYFQTSLPTDPDGRAITLKKIDEIEAQMSKQWWKSKQEGASAAAGGDRSPDGNSDLMPSQLPTQSPSVSDDAFDTTESIEIKRNDTSHGTNEFAATQMATGMMALTGKGAESNAGAAGFSHSDVGFSASNLFAMSSDEMATDPELEEAAIRFANGDDAGAEHGLLAALRGNELQPEAAQSWVAAVLDLYRATNARPAFDSAVKEFASHLNGLVPTWVSFAASAEVNAGSQSSVAFTASAHGAPIWNCPAILDAHAMETLRDCMGMYSMPWHLGWANLAIIDENAQTLLDGLFASLSEEAVAVAFSGSQALVLALRSKTPPGERNTDNKWWQVRLNALRVMRLQDDFDLAALDYCIIHELAPPAWVDAKCQYDDLGHVDATANNRADPGPATVPLTEGGQLLLALRGELMGDASEVLAELEKNETPGVKAVINCDGLLRVDFAAAGSILNWVAIRQAAGQQIQFQNAHRLVAAFFNVIGINEHAKVIARPV
jgi:ABC-type transporter Mla MlaB component